MLTVQAAQLILDGGAIKANSTGNIAAGSLQINFSDHLFLKRGSITTSANAGNGGAISIQGGKLIDLNNSEITTSVMGITGNGGNISISSQALAMNTGFIQANTAASNASGGNININVPVLVASGNNLLLGGNTQYSFQTGVFGYNVIQAAAPDGVSGAINIASPVLDISGSLVTLGTPMLDPGGLGRSPCQSTGGSSLGATGWESLPPSARDPLSGEAAAQQFHLSGNVSADRTLPPVRMATLLSRCQ
jgi:large exoprotein involved in heme utilization and adhesion